MRSRALSRAAVTALIAGAMALFDPACLIVYAAGVTWICVQQRKSSRSCIRLLAVLGGVPTLICLPWMVRNELVLHRLTLKSNFGTELRIGNNPLAPASTAAAVMKLHPAENEFALYRQLGELGYVDWCRHQAVTFIENNPFSFIKLTLRRVLIFWTGSENINWTGNLKASGNWSALKRIVMFGGGIAALFGLAVGCRYPDHILLLLTMAAYPLPYYLTHSINRYRMPLEPVLALLAAHSLVWVWRHWRRSRPSPALRAP